MSKDLELWPEEWKPDELVALAKFQSYQALTELKRRFPEPSPACPDCGSFEHFEC